MYLFKDGGFCLSDNLMYKFSTKDTAGLFLEGIVGGTIAKNCRGLGIYTLASYHFSHVRGTA